MASRAWQQIGAPTPSNGRKSGLFRMRAERGRAYPEAARTRLKKLASLALEVLGPGREPRGPAADLADRSRALPGRPLDRLDFGRGPRGVARRRLDAVGDLARRHRLLLDRGRDRGRPPPSTRGCCARSRRPRPPHLGSRPGSRRPAARFPRSRVRSGWPAPRKLLQNSAGAIVDIVVCEPSGQFGRDWRQRHRRTTIHWPEAAEIYGMNGCLSLNGPFRDKAASH